MKRYIEEILHQDVQIVPYEDIKKLPLTFRGVYEFNRMTIGRKEALLAAPREKISLVMLRKHHHQMEIYTGLPCVLYLSDINYYARDVMLKEGIPFVWEGHQIYLPFIGILLDDHQRKAATTCVQISYLTQKLLLTALYQDWHRITVTKASQILGVSKMSITRCFDELEAVNVPYLRVRNRARSITADADKRAMWETIRGIMRNPVIKTYVLREQPGIKLPLSGSTALAHYSMLDDGTYPIFAMTKKELKEVGITEDKMLPAGETPGCIIQELGYLIHYADGTAIDPLTVFLTISEEERSDPRVSMAIDEMLEEYVW